MSTTQPYDREAIAASVRRTHRVVVTQEAGLSFGYAAEIAARMAQDLFEELDAPVARCGGLNCPVGYAPVLEAETLPHVDRILESLRKTASY